eukprot:gene16091-19381_t
MNINSKKIKSRVASRPFGWWPALQKAACFLKPTVM